jgi:O-Antigen ligase
MTTPALSWPFTKENRNFRIEFRLLLVVCWLLSATCLSMPGRNGPLDVGAFDWLAMLKTAMRGTSLVLVAWLLLRLNFHARTVPVVQCLLPFGVFSTWAALSFLWSPMKVVTLGHAMELVTLVGLAICGGILVDSEARRSTLCLNLFVALVSFSLVVLVLDFPAIWNGQRPAGFMHPNALGAISTSALILLLTCRFFWSWPWTAKLLIPGTAVSLIGVYAARSRSALLGSFLILITLFWIARRRGLVLTLLAGGGVLLALLPYARLIAEIPQKVETYVMRDQTRDDLAEASGRSELWSRAVEAFSESPVLGNGYFMISRSGTLYVWLKNQDQTAHSLYLHVLTGTGLVGSGLFLWACTAAVGPSIRRMTQEFAAPDLLLLLLCTWFAVLGLVELSILGPVDPPTVLFFAILGATVQPLESRVPVLPLEANICA